MMDGIKLRVRMKLIFVSNGRKLNIYDVLCSCGGEGVKSEVR